MRGILDVPASLASDPRNNWLVRGHRRNERESLPTLRSFELISNVLAVFSLLPSSHLLSYQAARAHLESGEFREAGKNVPPWRHLVDCGLLSGSAARRRASIESIDVPRVSGASDQRIPKAKRHGGDGQRPGVSFVLEPVEARNEGKQEQKRNEASRDVRYLVGKRGLRRAWKKTLYRLAYHESQDYLNASGFLLAASSRENECSFPVTFDWNASSNNFYSRSISN